MTLTLEGSDAVHVATVLEDCVDQLVVLGRIMPASYENQATSTQMVADNITELLANQNVLQDKYNKVGNICKYLV